MSFANEMSALFRRDIGKVAQQVRAFPNDDLLWKLLPGVTNSAGNLALHLEGNLREYIGRRMGGVAYTRERPLEFSTSGLTAAEVASRLEAVQQLVPPIVAGRSDAALDEIFPEKIGGTEVTARQFLIHTHSHLNYHLGQIDYLRRILTAGQAIAYKL